MKLPDSWTTVTPFSKAFAFTLFILLPFFAFYLGSQYQQLKDTPAPVIVRITQLTTPTPAPARDQSLICGPMPVELFTTAKFEQLTGPLWSPDCRHIAWGRRISTPSRFTGPNPRDGIFVYTEKTGKTQRVYQPQGAEAVEFTGWLDSQNLHFTKNSQPPAYTLDLATGAVAP
ncbi:hypothetical protein M1116_03505 [Patescibacteria group bacterium]|nr:hypothetical protein [Patescibacteria group bacterium]